MQAGLLAVYAAAAYGDIAAHIMTLMILWSGFLMFGLDPTPTDKEQS